MTALIMLCVLRPALFYTLILVTELSQGAKLVNLKERLSRHVEKRGLRSVEAESPDRVLGLEHGEELKATDALLTASHTVKIKYAETYRDLAIIGSSVVLERTATGAYTKDISGTLLEDIEQDVPSIVPTLSAEDALLIALEKESRSVEHVLFRSDRDARLVIYTRPSPSGVRAVLAFQITFAIADPYFPVEPRYFIDAHTGEVLQSTNLIEAATRHRRLLRVIELHSKGGNEKVGSYTYGKDIESLKVITTDGVTCYVQNDNVSVVNLNFTTVVDDLDKDRSEGYSFPCDEGIHDSVNGGYSPISDAFFFFNKVSEMYRQYDLKPLKDRAIMVVHYGKGLENAYYMPSYNIMVMGDGGKRFHPLVGLGVVAHEVSHGFTMEHSGLVYEEQSGGINEAFSDMASEAAEAYLTMHADWMIGHEITKKKEDAFRWLADPSKDNISISSVQNYCPGMDVHCSSGVFNKAFYLLATRPGWDIKSAFHVFLVANKMYWSPTSDFADAACGAVKAAGDLGFSADDITEVFKQVDIIPCVNKKFGFQHLINLELPSDDLFERYFDIEGIDLERVKIEVWLYDEPSEYHMSVVYNGQEVLTLSDKKSNSAEVESPKPGRYYVKITGTTSSMSVYVISKHLFSGKIVTTLPNDYGLHGNVSFTLEAGDIMDTMGIVVRASGEHNHLYMFSMYGDPVDVYSMLYDVQGRELEVKVREALYCHPRAGVYDVAVLSYNHEADNTFNIKAYIVHNMFSDK